MEEYKFAYYRVDKIKQIPQIIRRMSTFYFVSINSEYRHFKCFLFSDSASTSGTTSSFSNSLTGKFSTKA